jgi:hypothetical protein
MIDLFHDGKLPRFLLGRQIRVQKNRGQLKASSHNRKLRLTTGDAELRPSAQRPDKNLEIAGKTIKALNDCG